MTGSIHERLTTLPNHAPPSTTRDEFERYIRPYRRWGRWGSDDQVGAINLIRPEGIVAAARLIVSGERVSLARPIPTRFAANNTSPPGHFVWPRDYSEVEEGAGASCDHLAISCHGQATTHLDAICHVWGRDGMWNGRDGRDAVAFNGVSWGAIDQWKDGIIARGVLIDVAKHRPEGYVRTDAPVTADELRSICRSDGIETRPGDALVIHSGRDAFERSTGKLWGAPATAGGGDEVKADRPGLAVSCLDFLYEADCSTLVWDMLDASPNTFGVRHAVHAAIYNQGIALLDNAALEPLSELAHRSGRLEFFFAVAPLVIQGGTGSPVNPIAIF